MPQLVVGMAGHIDHGKTSLVKALTGKNTDSLNDEKERGMTIDLGFAYLNSSITIIDVPGHEKFIRTMVAGAASIHIGLIVVAADDGIMPQTIEHLEILSLLGVNQGIVAITKIDLIQDHEWVEMVELEIIELMEKCKINLKEIHRLSNLNGDGVATLKKNIESLAIGIKKETGPARFRLNVDRFFSKKGFGTIAAGTVTNGVIEKGNDVEILPNKIKAKIRGIQTHGGAVRGVKTGDRAAINLANVLPSDLKRGTVLATPGFLILAKKIIARVTMTKSTKWIIKNKQRMRFHFGTTEVLGRCYGKRLKKGTSGNLILILESAVAVVFDDRFLLRSYSPMQTVAGGKVLDIEPEGKWAMLKIKAERVPTKPKIRFKFLIDYDWKSPKKRSSWESLFFISNNKLSGWIDELGIKESHTGLLYASAGVRKSTQLVIEFFKNSHKKKPFRSTFSFDEVLSKTRLSEDWLKFVLRRLTELQKLVYEGGGYYLFGHITEFSKKDNDNINTIESIILKSETNPILDTEISQRSGLSTIVVRQCVHHLQAKNKAEIVGENLYMHRSNIDAIIKNVNDFFEFNSKLTVGDFKKIAGLTRKTAIPLLEYLDRIQITLRNENIRLKGEPIDR